LSTTAVGAYGKTIRRLRSITEHTLDREPKWRKKGTELATGAKRTWK
jgi:hydrogenase small subunit